jgi:hypothetical protein
MGGWCSGLAAGTSRMTFVRPKCETIFAITGSYSRQPPIMAINGFRYSASPHNLPVLGSTTDYCFSEKAKCANFRVRRHPGPIHLLYARARYNYSGNPVPRYC